VFVIYLQGILEELQIAVLYIYYNGEQCRKPGGWYIYTAEMSCVRTVREFFKNELRFIPREYETRLNASLFSEATLIHLSLPQSSVSSVCCLRAYGKCLCTIRVSVVPYIIFFIIWFVRLLALRPLLAYCASLG
jgi:hypothetical protein